MNEPTLTGPELENAVVRQLHNVRVFLIIMTAGSIVAAARRMNKAPSAVTRSLQELERCIGRTLCERNAQGVVPTPHGRLTLTRAERIADELGRAAAELARDRSRSSSASPSALTDFLFNGRKLALLVQIGDAGTLSAAAEQSGIRQSGASMALSRMEAMLGLILFHRGKHGLSATQTAKRLMLHARRVFSESRHLAAELSDEAGVLRGSIVLGTSPLGRTHILPMAVAASLRRHPDIRITMIESAIGQLLASLRAGQIDAVVGVPRREEENSGLTIEPLFRDSMAVIARADHPLAARQLSHADLRDASWLLPWPHSPSRQLFDHGIRTLGLEPPAASVESADLATIRQLLLATDLLALVSARQMRFELRSGLAVELSTPLPVIARDVALITRKQALLSPAADAVMAAIRDQVRDEED
ncbi:LysR family transcriptional regulator [Sphingobium sp. AP50]|uniref:LysR family transcriptional regulator n=1 Tax=Sphingobium sp. AP50 TaxID=1884369 RepID=UPI0015A5DEA5|nr:LysR family transcriptional regulator [Sphingobium sp. AP50]